MEVKTQAFAKINVFLFVGNKRKDGFHDMISLMQKTSQFYDDIFLRYEESETNEIRIRGLEEYTKPEDSTVFKACSSWLEKTGHKAKIEVEVLKGIPVKSGLGGPSSDAGAVLLALERCTGNKTKLSKLVEIALSAGSDVPFFVYDCDAAIVSGRGEIVHPIEARTDAEFNLFPGPEVKKGTEEAYRKLDCLRKEHHILPSMADLVYAYRENPRFWVNTNDFEILYTKPCENAFLTGSGNYWFTVKISK